MIGLFLPQPPVEMPVASEKIITEVINYVIDIEGGYVNDPTDNGGETKYGITIAVARAEGYDGEMRKLSKAKARNIYYVKYWKVMKLDDVFSITDAGFVQKVLEMSVHIGTTRASEFLQWAIILAMNNHNPNAPPAILVDGKIGKQTLGVLKEFLNEERLVRTRKIERELTGLQMSYYYRLLLRHPEYLKFFIGWKKRVNHYDTDRDDK